MLLPAGLLLLVYLGGVRNTLSLWRICRENRVAIQNAANSIPTGDTVTAPADKTDPDRIHTDSTGKSDLHPLPVLQEEILARLAEALTRNHITVERYTPYLLARDGETDVYACEVLLRGSFKGLTRLLAEVEKDRSQGGLVSTDYRLMVNNQTRVKYLQLTLVIEQLDSKKEKRGSNTRFTGKHIQ